MTLERAALWWCYLFGGVAALALLAATVLWAIEQIVTLFKVKRAILDWAWSRARGYTLVPHDLPIKGAPVFVAQIQPDQDSPGLWIGFQTEAQRADVMKLFAVKPEGEGGK